MSKTNQALRSLINHVNEGMDYPDAEDRAQSEFNLTEVQVKEVRKCYDEEDGFQENDRVVTRNEFAGILGMFTRPL